MGASPLAGREEFEDDPVYRHCLREAVFIFSVWVACFVWTCAYCYLYGYSSHEPNPSGVSPIGGMVGPLESFNRSASDLTYPLGLGVPDWVFYGVVVPWVLCIALSFWYCLCFFVEDDLGEMVDEGGGAQ